MTPTEAKLTPKLDYDVLMGDGGRRNALPSDALKRSNSDGFSRDFGIVSFILLAKRGGGIVCVCSGFLEKSLSGGVVFGCGCRCCNDGVAVVLGGMFSTVCDRPWCNGACVRRY